MGLTTIAILSNVFAHPLFLKYPASAPNMFPIIQDSIVVVISNPAVHGSEFIINSITGVGNWNRDGPKSPRNNLPQNAKYCWNIPPSNPYISVSDFLNASTAAGSMNAPWDVI